MSWRAVLPIVLVLAFLCPLVPVTGREPRSFEDRVKAQEAVERVFYAHRAWPTVNPGPKPRHPRRPLPERRAKGFPPPGPEGQEVASASVRSSAGEGSGRRREGLRP